MNNLTLYPYQGEALRRVNSKFEISDRALVVMATGLGKTIVSAFFAQQELLNGKRGLFLCHENDILQQAENEYRNVLGHGYSLKTFYGENKDWNADKADVLFASFQSFVEWCKVFTPDHFDFVIVDESHHGQAPTFKEVINYFTPKKLLGMTATPDRMDEKDIRDIFGEEVVNYCLEEAIANGWLTKIEYHVLNDDLGNLDRLVKLVDERRVTLNQLNKTIFIKMRDEVIASMLKEFAGTKKAIIFCQSIEHAENFSQHLEKSAVVHSKSSSVKNAQTLQDFRNGIIQFVLAVNMFNEGIDVPDTEVVVFLRCTDSRTIILQQLGRGLRKSVGKDKVMVLDFVSNCERLLLLNNLITNIERFAGDKVRLFKDKLHISGDSFNFIFNDRQVDIINLLNGFNEDFYPTWQEASRAAIELGINTWTEYQKNYKNDLKLPSCPEKFYNDFPGFTVFLNGAELYLNLEDAIKAIYELGIKSSVEYKNRHHEDPRLPSNLNIFYKNFPGWLALTGRNNRYKTWQEAAKASLEIGICSSLEYKQLYKNDPRLPPDPNDYYSDFPGFRYFLKTFYLKWQEASDAAIQLKIYSKDEYSKKRSADSKLPSDPRKFYPDFPGWTVFLDECKFYNTWEEASLSAINLGINNRTAYKERCKIDNKLHSAPHKFYPDFPGWTVFLDECKFYNTWEEASLSAISLGIMTEREYKKMYKTDSKLPSNPNKSYKDFPGYDKFLGKD